MLYSEQLGLVTLLHFYCAQGLTKQNEDQQALLARMADFELARAVVQAARNLLHITRVRPIVRNRDSLSSWATWWEKRLVVVVVG